MFKDCMENSSTAEDTESNNDILDILLIPEVEAIGKRLDTSMEKKFKNA